MAYVQFTNGKRQLYTKPEEILRLILVWYVITGQKQAMDARLKAYCHRVKSVKLNWHEAPDDYIRWNLNELIAKAVSEWAVDQHGKPVRPTSNAGWIFAKKYGLWKAGKPTNLVTGRQTTLV